jgi:hypothetical protein
LVFARELPEPQEALWTAVGELLNHLDGLHGDDVLVQLVAEGA